MSCYLQDLFTIPEVRGGGVGRHLIDAFCDRARESGAHASIGTRTIRTQWQGTCMTRLRMIPASLSTGRLSDHPNYVDAKHVLIHALRLARCRLVPGGTGKYLCFPTTASEAFPEPTPDR